MKRVASACQRGARRGLLAAGLWTAALSWAQSVPSTAPTTPAVACSGAADMTPAHLFGLWQLTLWSPTGSASVPSSTGTLTFERHPDYPGSVRGQLQRLASGHLVRALVSGDVVDGGFHLDESADGIAIDAVWSGVPGDCGQTVRGTRSPAGTQTEAAEPLQFLLRKSPGWR